MVLEFIFIEVLVITSHDLAACTSTLYLSRLPYASYDILMQSNVRPNNVSRRLDTSPSYNSDNEIVVPYDSDSDSVYGSDAGVSNIKPAHR